MCVQNAGAALLTMGLIAAPDADPVRLAARAPRAEPPRVLVPGVSAERSLAPDETHTYEIPLEEQQLLHAEVVPTGINLVVRVIRPDGTQWMSLDYGDEATPETILLIADTGGSHRIEVLAGPGVPAGRYSIRAVTARVATESDAAWVAARRKLEDGIRQIGTLPPSAWGPLVESFQAALAGFRHVADRAGEARALYQLAFAAEGMRRPDARERAVEALALYTDLGDPNGMGKAEFELGTLHDRFGEMPAARAAFERSLDLFRRASNRTWEASAGNGLGIVHAKTGDSEGAIHQFLLALEAARAMKASYVEMSALNNLGIASKTLGDYRAALAYYEQALVVSRTLADRGWEANVLNNLGNLYRLLGDDAKALAVHQDALLIARQVKNPEHESRALNALGLTHARSGRYREARDYHQQALTIRREMKSPAPLVASLDATGRVWQKLGDAAEARAHLAEALELARALGDPRLESQTLESMALVERDAGNLAAALLHITGSVELTDSLRLRVASPDLRASFVASAQDQYELHTDILMRLHRQSPDGGFERLALEASERGRARVLLESLLESRTDIRQGVDPALLEQEQTSARRIEEASGRLSRLLGQQAPAGQIDEARAALAALMKEARAIGARIRHESPAYAALTQATSIGVAEMQRDLIDGATVLLEYALGDARSWLWMVTSTAVASFELPPRGDIERAARGFYTGVTARQLRGGESSRARRARVAAADAELVRQSAALGQALLGPVAAHLGADWRGKRLLVVAPDALQYVPFAALLDPANPGEALAADHEIVSLPSASVLAAVRRETAGRAAPPGSLAVVADPVFDVGDPRLGTAARSRSPGGTGAPPAAGFAARAMRSAEAIGTPLVRLSRLPFSREEARAIAGLVPPAERLEALDFDASRATATSGKLAGYRIVHIATHGILNSEQPELSGLVLALVTRDGGTQDGFLRLSDIYNLKVPADLVVLSGCQTALGQAVRGEGLVGLTRGFMYAGARRVVASLWQVDDLATAELMRLFYRGMLRENRRPAAALRAAQLELARDPRWASPFFWSAFVIQGEWR